MKAKALVGLAIAWACLAPVIGNRVEDGCYRPTSPPEWRIENGYDYANGEWTYYGTTVAYAQSEDSEIDVCVDQP